MATSNNAQDVVRCKYCQHNAVELYCKNCEHEICQTCMNGHNLNHVIVPYPQREWDKNRCKYHHTCFYTQGCKQCGIPICPECKIKSHYQHKDTDIITVCEKARMKIQNGLTDMQNKERDVDKYVTKEARFSRSQNSEEVIKNLQDRATEMKSCIDNVLSKSILEVKNLEYHYQNYISELSKKLKEKRKTCENDIKKLKTIELPFYLNENPDWNYVSKPHGIQGLQYARFEPKPLDKSELESLFGYLSLRETNMGQLFEKPQPKRTKTPERNYNSQPKDIHGLQIVRPALGRTDRYELESFFGTLSSKETNVRQKYENTLTKRPKTAAPKLGDPELSFRGNAPIRYQEGSKTERFCHTRHNFTSFYSKNNMNRTKMGIREIPVLLKEFKSSVNFLFQIAYDEQILRLFISGHTSNLYAYQNVLGAKDVDPKYETLNVENEPQGLAIGYQNKLVFSDSQNGVIEIGRNVILANRNRMTIDIGRNARVLFYKEGYNLWGIHYASSGSYLICAMPYDQKHQHASVIRISRDGRVENEFTRNERDEPIFSKPMYVCENRLNQNICVSDMDSKIIVLTFSGEFRFNYKGVQPEGKKAPFDPRGIACDEQGNILVADLGNDVIHMLKSNGEFVTHVLSSISPISQPWGICVDSQNRVWVVERNIHSGDVKTYAKVKVFQIYET